MKIAIINTEKGFRGGERQTLFLGDALYKRGFDVTLLALRGFILFEKAKEYKFKVLGFKKRGELFHYLVRKGKGFDVLIPFDSKSHEISIISKPFHSSKVIYTRRVNFKPSLLSVFFKYRFTDVVVAISNSVKDTLLKRGIKNVVVIPSFVRFRDLNFKRVFPLREKYGGRKIVGIVSAISEEKDPFTLLEVCKKLSLVRDDFVFLHFGDGPLRGIFEKKLKDMGLEYFYKVYGYVPEVEDYYSIFDLFLITSKNEGLCSAILDSFLYEVPVVATDGGGIRELVEGRGILCKVGDVGCIVKGIHRLLEDEKICLILKENAKTFVLENFSEDVVINRFVEILNGFK